MLFTLRNIKIDENTPNYSSIAKILHWGFVVFFAYGIIKQVDNLDQLKDSSLLKFEIFFASAFLFFLVVRFFYMKKTQKSSLPPRTSKVQKLLARLVHLGMYLTLGGIAFSGLVIGFLFWTGLRGGLLIEIVIAIHEFLIPIMYWLIVIHVAAAIYHRLQRDGVWGSMVPFWKE